MTFLSRNTRFNSRHFWVCYQALNTFNDVWVGGLFAKQLYDALDVHKITNRLALDGRFSTNARLQTSDLGTRLLCKNEYQMRTISAIWSQPLNIHS